MDDAIGIARPDDPSRYTMRLNADGTVELRLDCNRGRGSWSAEAVGDGDSGSFDFGPLAVTRALCPPPNLDEQIATQAEYVRSYLLDDGRLHLSLMADGGILVWEPGLSGPSSPEPDPDLEASILSAEPDYTREVVAIDGRGARYAYARLDLNGDERGEILVYLMGSVFCGSGGCNLLLFTDTGDGYALVDRFPITRLPVIVSAETAGGWNVIVRRESGGGAPPSWVEHAFDGEHYAEATRRPGDASPQGRRLLEGASYETGIPLTPRRY
jgi:heat shock protein HslJ